MKTEAGENRGGTNEMKKIMIIAAAAIAVLAGCSKEMETVSPGSITFEKGQTVTLNVIAGTTETRVSSQLDITSGNVNFRWQAGDSIKVKVGVDSAVFTITSFSADSTVGTFTSRMPAGDSIFSVQYPYTEPVLTNQTYSITEPIPHNMMKFAADSCSLASPSFILEPQYAALRLNLYGTSKTISKIAVTNTTSTDDPKPTYTLNISGGVTLPTNEAAAQAFFIVVPAGDWNFTAEVTSALATPPADAIQNGVFTVGDNKFTTSSPKTFTAGRILNMDAKKVGITKVYFSKGNLYYDGSTSTWGFESNQYDFRTIEGKPCCINSVYSFTGTPAGHYGLFTRSLASNYYGATTSTDLSDYSGDFVDWGSAIDNNGTWYTMSVEECTYLINSRLGNSAPEIGSQTDARFAMVMVNGLKGLLIFPDTFIWPSDVTDMPTTFNVPESNWNSVNYTAVQFSSLQSAGCVFLPVTDYRFGSGMWTYNLDAYYHLSTAYGSIGGRTLHFRDDRINPKEYDGTRTWGPTYGASVRLVSAAQ